LELQREKQHYSFKKEDDWFSQNPLFYKGFWSLHKHYLDMVGVRGSNPLSPI